MTEWGVVSVVVVLVGLFFTVSNPVMKLVKTITDLTSTVKTLRNDLDAVTKKNTESHRRLWERSEAQDERLDDHDKRIERLEGKV